MKVSLCRLLMIENYVLLLQVMDEGEIKEFDSPFILIQQENSIFSNLVEQTGVAQAAELRFLAADFHHGRHPMSPEPFINGVSYSTYL